MVVFRVPSIVRNLSITPAFNTNVPYFADPSLPSMESLSEIVGTRSQHARIRTEI